MIPDANLYCPAPGLELVTAPAEEPLTLAEAKLHLRVTASDEDARITSLITSARQRCEAQLKRAFITQTWDWTFTGWPGGVLRMPLPRLQSITSITYLDSDGASQTLATSVYKARAGSPGWIILKSNQSWPSLLDELDNVIVRFVAGYGGASAVPDCVKDAMYLLIGSGYEHREHYVVGTIAGELQGAIDDLLAPEMWGFSA